MSHTPLHIAIIEPSPIIYEGLHAVLSQSDMACNLIKSDSLEELEQTLTHRKTDILIANPMQLANREKEVRRLRKNHPKLAIVGINPGIIDQQLQSLFDASFTIFDTSDQVVDLLQKTGSKNSEQNTQNGDNNLTDRELDVLIQLVNGSSNKEIADLLNISIHTVATHRKNITAKTGIRSQSGLAIYAISKKIIAIDDIDLQNQ